MRLAWSTRLATLSFLSLLFLWPLGRASAQPLFSPTQDPLVGSRVFGIKGCGSCHAIKGVGPAVAPDLGRIPRPRSFYDLAAAMWNHLPRMAERMRQRAVPRPHLDAREAGDLIAFLYTLDYFDPPGNAGAGRRLFVAKRCVVCHQVGGVGGVVGPNLDFIRQYGSPILVAAAMWNHGPAMAEAMRLRRIERPTFRESELLDLIAFLKGASPGPVEGPLYVLPGRAAEGRRLFAEKRCLACHGVVGQGGRVGPDLAERAVHRSQTQFAAAMWNKAPAMLQAMKARGIPVPQLTAEEMADLVAYLYSVRYFAEPGDARRGQELAAAKGCLTCHTISGRGGKVAGDLARVKGLDSPPAVIAVLWNHAFLMEQWPEPQKVAWPRFRPEEMADLVAFLRGTGRGR
ncbi:MAG: cytochrome c [candidate division NC10 bacterium]|nr:cytochrome c [candidate division NC10 bacterium]